MGGQMLLSEEMTRLCNLIYTNPGAYALIIGSGLSSLAGIETAYGIQIQLAKRVLKMDELLPKGELSDEEVEKLFREKYSNFSYESLLDKLNITSTERSYCIKEFIEQRKEDIDSGKRIPTVAHKAIAMMVKKGYVKVIITTNFDRLIEKSLNDEHIAYQCIYKPGDIDAIPSLFTLKDCLIIKPNGDYLATDTKNLSSELNIYDEKLEDYLANIAKHFGLIAFGWSVEYDNALREIFSLSPCKHFSSYICRYNSQWKAEAEELKNKRCMRIIDIKQDDDDFFQSVLNGIESLEELSDTEKSVNFETFKRLLVQPNKNISVINTIEKKTNKIIEQITNLPNEADQIGFFHEIVIKKQAVDLCSFLALLTAYDDRGLYEQLVTESIEKLCLHPKLVSRNVSGSFHTYREIDNLPCLMVQFTVCMVGLKKSKINYLSSSLISPQKRVNNNHQISADKVLEHVQLGILTEDINIFTEEGLSTPDQVMLFLMKLINDQVHIFQDADEIDKLFVDSETLIHLIEVTFSGYYTYMSNIFIAYFRLGNMDDFFDSMINLIERSPDKQLFSASTTKFVGESVKLVTELKDRINQQTERFNGPTERLDQLLQYFDYLWSAPNQNS